jgi:DMSO/TMAO reductase YedYZ molybdopterin-dependent catalytic subunit
MPSISRGFRRRHELDPDQAARIPPGQHLVPDFPVLTYGPTPRRRTEEWTLRIDGEVDQPRWWTWEEFQRLPSEAITRDIHCVTSWSKLDTQWQGVSLDVLLEGVQTTARYVVASCDGGYTTNLPLEDLTGGKAWVAYRYDDRPLEAEHGGPARLLVPHLYFWKSAKWIRSLVLHTSDQPGFWEENGYHLRGDPWREQRYRDD